MSVVLVALIVATASMSGPMLLARQNGRRADAKEERDNERLDAVAEKAHRVALVTAETTGEIKEQLVQVHALVNSDMTAMMEALLTSLKAQLANHPDEIERAELTGRIAALQAKVRDRHTINGH